MFLFTLVTAEMCEGTEDRTHTALGFTGFCARKGATGKDNAECFANVERSVVNYFLEQMEIDIKTFMKLEFDDVSIYASNHTALQKGDKETGYVFW